MSSQNALNAKQKSQLAEMPLAERERALWSASEMYMRGEITLDELKEVEYPYYSLEYERASSQHIGSQGQARRSFLLWPILCKLFLRFRTPTEDTSTKRRDKNIMLSSQRTLWPIIGVICLLIIVIVLIILWPYRELIGFLVVGLGILAALVMLALHIARTWTDVIVKLHEQKLRQGRLRPNDDGYYEIPLDGGKGPMSPPSNPQLSEGQKPYSQVYDPRDSSNK